VGHGQTGNFANEWQGIGNNEPYLHFKALTQARAVKVFSLLPQRTQPKAKPTRRSKSVTELSNREGLRAKRDKQPRVVPSNSSSSTHMGMGVKTKSPPEFVGSKLRKLSVAGLHIICFMAMACTLNAHLITRNGRGTIQPAHHHGPPRRLWRQIKLISFFWFPSAFSQFFPLFCPFCCAVLRLIKSLLLPLKCGESFCFFFAKAAQDVLYM